MAKRQRRHLWAKAPEAFITDPDLTPSARIVYEWLDLRAGKRGYWHGGQQEIAQALSMGERTVRAATKLLAAAGYITRERSADLRTVYLYWIVERVDPDEIGPPPAAADRQELAGLRARVPIRIGPQITKERRGTRLILV